MQLRDVPYNALCLIDHFYYYRFGHTDQATYAGHSAPTQFTFDKEVGGCPDPRGNYGPEQSSRIGDSQTQPYFAAEVPNAHRGT